MILYVHYDQTYIPEPSHNNPSSNRCRESFPREILQNRSSSQRPEFLHLLGAEKRIPFQRYTFLSVRTADISRLFSHRLLRPAPPYPAAGPTSCPNPHGYRCIYLPSCKFPLRRTCMEQSSNCWVSPPPILSTSCVPSLDAK